MKCKRCRERAVVALPSHNAGFCKDCFLVFFSRMVEKAVRRRGLLAKDDRVLVALSGGKDSLALMCELGLQGYDVTGLHVDLGIPDSSGPARRTVEDFCAARGFKLMVLEMEAHGLAIPRVKAAVNRPICSACGMVKRYWFNKTALDMGFDVQCTGHNLDDEVARLFANTLRWDRAYLAGQGPDLDAEDGFTRKVRPLYRLGEFETAAYCFLQGIDYHTAPCPYSRGASFTGHKKLWADLEERMPGQKLAFYEGFLDKAREAFRAQELREGPVLEPCGRCGYPTTAGVCGVCRIREAVAR